MAASSSHLLLHKPICNFCYGASSVPAYITSNRFRSSNFIFPLNRRKIRRSTQNSIFSLVMDDLVKTNLRRDDEKQFQALEQESLISNSSKLQNELISDAGGGIEAVANRLTWLRVSQKLHTTSQVVVGAIVGSVYSTLWYITWNSIVLEAFTSSFSVQAAVFLVAAASVLGFAVYVLLNWFKDDK